MGWGSDVRAVFPVLPLRAGLVRARLPDGTLPHLGTLPAVAAADAAAFIPALRANTPVHLHRFLLWLVL